MSARVRIAVLAGIALAVAAVPVLLNRSSRNEPIAAEDFVADQSRAEFDRQQALLRRAFASPEFARALRARTLRPGDPVARLLIPKLGVDLIVVEGTAGNSLRAGAGHYADSALPGDPNNMAIAGHRTGFGRPFLHLDKLIQGDLLVLETPEGPFTYRLAPPFDGHTNPWVAEPIDWGVVGPTGSATVTLSTTDPPHASTNRLIARFALVKSEPAGD